MEGGKLLSPPNCPVLEHLFFCTNPRFLSFLQAGRYSAPPTGKRQSSIWKKKNASCTGYIKCFSHKTVA